MEIMLHIFPCLFHYYFYILDIQRYNNFSQIPQDYCLKKIYDLKPKGKKLKKNDNKVLATCKNVISVIFTITVPMGKLFTVFLAMLTFYLKNNNKNLVPLVTIRNR